MPSCLLQFQGQKLARSPGTFQCLDLNFLCFHGNSPNSAFDLSCHLSRLIEGKEVEIHNVILEDLGPQPL